MITWWDAFGMRNCRSERNETFRPRSQASPGTALPARLCLAWELPARRSLAGSASQAEPEDVSQLNSRKPLDKQRSCGEPVAPPRIHVSPYSSLPAISREIGTYDDSIVRHPQAEPGNERKAE